MGAAAIVISEIFPTWDNPFAILSLSSGRPMSAPYSEIRLS
jgi:hypothetical protein